MNKHRVYISSSWKQRDRVRALADKLRSEFDLFVYDFTDPRTRKSAEIPPERFPAPFDPLQHDYGEYLDRPEWRGAVLENKNEVLRRSDLVVLLLPCGADAHADWALAVGAGKPTVVVGHPLAGERTPSHLWADAILKDEAALVEWLRVWRKPAAAIREKVKSESDTGEFVPRWSTALSRLRTARRFAWLALEVAFGPRQPIVVVSTPILDKETTHPSQLCQCPCGYDAPAAEHLEACEWRKRMCGTCDGSGHCGGCGGDGTRPDVEVEAAVRPCCENEQRDMRGGCTSCGAPCF